MNIPIKLLNFVKFSDELMIIFGTTSFRTLSTKDDNSAVCIKN